MSPTRKNSTNDTNGTPRKDSTPPNAPKNADQSLDNPDNAAAVKRVLDEAFEAERSIADTNAQLAALLDAHDARFFWDGVGTPHTWCIGGPKGINPPTWESESFTAPDLYHAKRDAVTYLAALPAPRIRGGIMTLPEYNGWTNYPTWCVHLWLTNDEQTDNAARAAVIDLDGIAADEAVREFVEELIYGDHAPAGMQTDLTSWALALVDWPAITDALKAE